MCDPEEAEEMREKGNYGFMYIPVPQSARWIKENLYEIDALTTGRYRRYR